MSVLRRGPGVVESAAGGGFEDDLAHLPVDFVGGGGGSEVVEGGAEGGDVLGGEGGVGVGPQASRFSRNMRAQAAVATGFLTKRLEMRRRPGTRPSCSTRRPT